MKPIHIIYAGGSGGHICAHLILSSKQHFCVFDKFSITQTAQEFEQQFEFVKQDQWAIERPADWKRREHWPVNHKTNSVSVPDLSKLLLTCNPGKIDLVINPEHINVLIYTDIDTQYEIAKFKRCWIFESVLDLDQHCYNLCNQVWSTSYNNVKDSGWPMVELNDLPTLSMNIQTELFDLHQGFDIWADWLVHRDNCETYKTLYVSSEAQARIGQDWVTQSIADIAGQVDHVIKLQDVVATKGKILLNSVDLPYFSQHQDLFDRWFNLHSYELQLTLV